MLGSRVAVRVILVTHLGTTGKQIIVPSSPSHALKPTLHLTGPVLHLSLAFKRLIYK